ncbi:MAG: D-aminoacylase [Armatimonadetes bacterium]|nr:D-aminoacylase [Armatimonadota bacterium]
MRAFELIIRNGLLFDGTGAPARPADIGIRGDTIAAVGDLAGAESARTVNAAGLSVTPGFIDIHAHSDLTVQVNPAAESKVRQGVTLEVNGQCGYSPFPVNPGDRAELDALNPFVTAQPDWTWTTTADFLSALRATAPSINLGQLAGHSALRARVMGFANSAASPSQVAAICDEARAALDEGAIGISFGLAYALGSFAANDEIEAVCLVAAQAGAMVSVHIRNEGELLLESIGEMLDIARRVSETAPLRLQFDHLKASGKRWWGRVADALELLESARSEGLDIAFDVYPYIAGSRHLSGSLPAWMHDGGNEALVKRLADPDCRKRLRAQHDAWLRGEIGHSPFELDFDRIVVTEVLTDGNAWTVGKNLAEVASERGQDAIDATLDLLMEERAQVSVVLFSMTEEDMTRALKHPLGCIGTDGLVFAPYGPLSRGKPHPRSYGTFPRAIGRYARDAGLMPVEEAIRKCTSWPASRLGLRDRGTIREGMKADLVLFDQDTLLDRATFEDPHQYPSGIAQVIVNGQTVIDTDRNLAPGSGEVVKRS